MTETPRNLEKYLPALQTHLEKSVLFLCVAAVALVHAGCGREQKSAGADGKQLFASTCARCHGENGTGGLAAEAGPAPRNFHDADFQRSRTDAQLRATIVNGKGGAMPSFGSAFNDTELTALVEQVRACQ